ncbi:MAG: PadR family transcriptional regulator [Flavobacteriales bacterium]|nr:PadR family transcriptional regulator [Flavobacteriales bacterium]
MKQDQSYKKELLTSWEETYKKGQLTFWLLLGLRDKPLYVTEIKEFITSSTNGTISCEEQSIYRSLRKYYDLEIVDYELRQGYKGPDRKYYFLTSLGKDLLKDFTKRNISILYNESLSALINNTKL